MTLLDGVTTRFSAARDLVVRHRLVEWPSLSSAMEALRALRRAQPFGMSSALDDALAQAQMWSSRITSAPLSAGNEAVGTAEFGAQIRSALDSGLDSANRLHLAQLDAALTQLINEPHPGSDALVAAICNYERSALVCRGRDQDQFRTWLSGEDLEATVVTLSGLHDVPVVDGVIVCGPPYKLAASRWCQGLDAHRAVGWLFATPPCSELFIVSWPGHGRIEAPASLLPGGHARELVVDASPVRPHSVPSFGIDDIWAPETASMKIRYAADLHDREAVPAAAVVLADNSVVFFGIDEGPKPQKVTWDVGDLAVTAQPVDRLRVGNALAVKAHRTGSDVDLESRADAILASKFGAGEAQAARAAKDDLKRAARLAMVKRHVEDLVREFARLVGDAGYAQSVFNNIARRDYIAPQKSGAFEAFCKVIGHNVDLVRQRQLLFRLRAAQRRAGVEVTDEMKGVLRTSTEWHEPLEERGHVSIASSTGSGRLVIAAIVSIEPGPFRVSRSWLGERRTDVPTQLSREKL